MSKKHNTKRQKEWRKIKRKYPFLIQRSHWYTGMKLKKKEQKESPPMLFAGDLPKGWVECFAEEMCEEIKKDLIQHGCLYTAYISDAKEKYGEMRLYMCGLPMTSRADDIIEKYSVISKNVCCKCGKLDTPMVNIYGWFSPICQECYEDIQKYISTNRYIPYEEAVCKNENGKTTDSYTRIRYCTAGKADAETIDISETVEKLKERRKDK